MTRFLKSVIVGIVAAVAAPVVWVFVVVMLPRYIPYLVSRLTGIFLISPIWRATVGTGSMIVFAVVGFAAAFSWTFRVRRHR